MSCPKPETLLEFVGGRLVGPDEARFEEHLDVCEACRQLAAQAARKRPGERSTATTTPLAGAARAPPIGELANYQLEGILSQGGHGVVWRARDLRLDRLVALKQVRLDDPRATARFAREMRITARLSHPSIVKLHEAGASRDGEQFYTMELVDGPTLLERIAQTKSFAGRLALLPHAIAIAEALAYAHDRRIIHRDLKPANVVVGSFGETIILDWGLAKDLAANEADDDPSGPAPSPGTTAAGTVLGTPSYMPPEQASAHPADERSDVYAIGAILYQVLTGSPPYAGATSDEVLKRIVSVDAIPVEKLEPRVPPDLAAIVRRAMARAPEARYPTAKELAADLKKFTTGELVAAHRYRLWELARHWIRRNRAVAASAVAIAVIVALWLRSILGAREQARLVQQFAQEAEAIESTLRIAELMPLHDIRGERAKVRERMASVEQKLAVLGGFAQGPGRYALGRGAFALHDLAAARAQLEQAWAAGYRAPDVAYALGQTLGEQYRAALDEVDATESQSAREDRRKAAERDLRDPALAYLRAGLGARSATPLLAEALIALFEGRYPEALTGAEAAQRAAPSLYQAARLAGDTLTRMAADRRERGDLAAAYDLSARARSAYGRALEVGRSDELSYLGECNLHVQLVLFHQDRGLPADADSADGLAVCDRALAVNPDSAQAFNHKSAIHRLLAERQSMSGIDPRPTLALSIAMAREALRRDPSSHLAWLNIGNAWHRQGRFWETRHGIDPRPSFTQAIESFAKAIALRPTSLSLMNLGSAHSAFAYYEAKHAGDPTPHWEAALQSSRRAIALDPRLADAYNMLGFVFQTRADWELSRGVDPRAAVASAVEALRRAIDLQPGFKAFTNIGVSLWFRAAWERAQGLDCTAAVEESVRSSRQALALTPTYAYGYVNIADSYGLLATYQMDRRLDPSASLRQARAALDEGIKLNAKDHYNYLQRAHIELLTARQALPGPGARAPFEAALSAASTAEELNPKDADGPKLEAEIRRWRAEWLLGRGESAAGEIQRGLSAAERALALDAQLAEAVAVRGALLALQSRVESSPGRRSALATEARNSLTHAREMNPLLARDYPP